MYDIKIRKLDELIEKEDKKRAGGIFEVLLVKYLL